MERYKQTDKLINQDAKITSIITHGIKRQHIIPNLLGQFSNKRVMIWQKSEAYFPCNRCTLYYGTDLKYMLDWCLSDFDVLIVNSFVEHANSQETKEFIKLVATDEKYKNKQFIFMFTKAPESEKLKLEHFKNYKDTIEKYSDSIFNLRSGTGLDGYEFIDLKTNKEIKLLTQIFYNTTCVRIVRE